MANKTGKERRSDQSTHQYGETTGRGVATLTSANFSVAVKHFLSASTRLSLVTARGSFAGCVCVCMCVCVGGGGGGGASTLVSQCYNW